MAPLSPGRYEWAIELYKNNGSYGYSANAIDVPAGDPDNAGAPFDMGVMKISPETVKYMVDFFSQP